jgi:hypothetical protein
MLPQGHATPPPAGPTPKQYAVPPSWQSSGTRSLLVSSSQLFGTRSPSQSGVPEATSQLSITPFALQSGAPVASSQVSIAPSASQSEAPSAMSHESGRLLRLQSGTPDARSQESGTWFRLQSGVNPELVSMTSAKPLLLLTR